MPLATNPRALFEIILESDKERPEGERPVFIYHYLTGYQQIEMSEMLTKSSSALSGSDFIRDNFKAAAMGLVGWRNIFDDEGNGLTFNPDLLPKLMGVGEALELAWKVFAKQIPSLEDKKKLESPSESDTERSAKDARAAKSATTE